ncbi:4-hydroxyphenylpyruvate dioxygenase [Vitis vinifera]|uniref:4-hydroxyphenylpyruvate dioxygenase n=1 Tax=Vitis vinifera TaxID=29760 RepID=A0A438EQA5_VITVI|nr:4-hydroxyphenylpyruvate dioxygenase [Vitis vinifera]
MGKASDNGAGSSWWASPTSCAPTPCPSFRCQAVPPYRVLVHQCHQSSPSLLLGLGMPIVVKSNNSTGNVIYASYLIHSDDLNFLFTAPYSPSIAGDLENAEAIEVKDAEGAFHTSITDSASRCRLRSRWVAPS